MKILSSFIVGASFTKKINPVIRIREVETGRIIINWAEMKHVGDGNYSYDFKNSKEGTKYCSVVDGGEFLDSETRYQNATFETEKKKVEKVVKKEVKINVINKRYNDRYLTLQENRLSKRLKNVFDIQMSWVIDNIIKFFPENKIQKNLSEQEVEIFLQGLPEQKKLADELLEAEKITLAKGGNDSVKLYKLATYGIAFDLKHPDAIDYLNKKHTLELLSNYRGNITGTTKKRLKDILVKGADEGLSYTAIAKEITSQGEAGVFSLARGKLISTTEIGRAYAQGNRIPINDFARTYPDIQTYKRWNTVKDGDVRPHHSEAEAQGFIPLNEIHQGTNEDMAPSRIDFRCRCAETYRIGED